MTPNEVAAKLQHFNDWRRGHHDDAAQPDPREIGEAIDVAVEMIERLEAAEKERDALRVDKATLQQMLYSIKNRLEAAEKSDAESIAMYRTARDERDELRAKIAGLVPIGLLHVGGYYGEELQDWEFEADQQACDRLNEAHFQREAALNLYALPGAKGE